MTLDGEIIQEYKYYVLGFVAADGKKLVSGLFSDLKVEMEKLIITLQKPDSRNATRSIST
jgi:hypothetical protein